MKIEISTLLDYRLGDSVDLMLQIEAADGDGQHVLRSALDLGPDGDVARVAGQDGIGERLWLHRGGRLRAHYSALVEIDRRGPDYRTRAAVAPHRVPAEAVPYLNESRYCPSNKLHAFVERRFGEHEGGAKIARMRDWVESRFTYVPGTSDADTGALDSFVDARRTSRSIRTPGTTVRPYHRRIRRNGLEQCLWVAVRESAASIQLGGLSARPRLPLY